MRENAMIHDSSNFKLSQMFANVVHGCNIDDDIVGIITFNQGQFAYNGGSKLFLETKSSKSQTSPKTQKRNPINYAKPVFQNERIVLLLESPSNDEYIGTRFRPAYGKTGFRIDNQLIRLLNAYLNVCFSTLPQKGQVFDVIFVNAIRYQCDLGYQGNRAVINSVFDQLWNEKCDPFSDDLLERINIIKPKLLINSCSSKNGIKLCSTSFLKNNLNYHIVETTNHPSRWTKKTIIF